MSTPSVKNVTNDRKLIESPFGTAGQFPLEVRSVTDLHHVVNSDYKHKGASSKKGAIPGAMFHLSLSNVHYACLRATRAIESTVDRFHKKVYSGPWPR